MDILSRYHGHGAVGFQNHPVGIGIRRNPGGAQGRRYLFFRNTRSRHRIARILTLVSEQGRFRLHDIGDISTLQNKLRRNELAGRENHNSAIASILATLRSKIPLAARLPTAKLMIQSKLLNSLVVRFPTTRTITMTRM